MIIAAPARFRDHLAGVSRDAEVRFYEGAQDAPAAAAEAEVMWLSLWRLDHSSAAVEAGRRLRWIHTDGAGVDFHPLELMRERGVVLTNGAGLHAIPIAEYTVMGMLAAAKALPRLVLAQTERRWAREEAARRELFGSAALVVGYGSIGRAIAGRLRPFGVEVTGVRARPDGEAGVIGAGEWRSRLGEFDWVILATPLTPATRGLIGAPELAAMRPDAWLVNVARGSLVDEAALVAALRSGQIGGAYLDVTEAEPPPADSELWEVPNLILTPHISGSSVHGVERAAARFIEQLGRYRAGRPLEHVVDLSRGY